MSSESQSLFDGAESPDEEPENHQDLNMDNNNADIIPGIVPGLSQDASSPSPESIAETTIKEEPQDLEYECPSSPDVPNDPEQDAKVQTRFRRTDDDDRNACARCGLVYILKRQKKEKPAPKVSPMFSFLCGKNLI